MTLLNINTNSSTTMAFTPSISSAGQDSDPDGSSKQRRIGSKSPTAASSESPLLSYRSRQDDQDIPRTPSSDQSLSRLNSAERPMQSGQDLETHNKHDGFITTRKQNPSHQPRVRWWERPAIKIEVQGLPYFPASYDDEGSSDSKTAYVHSLFKRYGNITYIEIIDEGKRQRPEDKRPKPMAYLTFRPVPKQNFWSSGRLSVQGPNAESRSRPWWIKVYLCPDTFLVPWKIGTSTRNYSETLELSATSLDFGVLTDHSAMKAFHTTQSTPNIPVSVQLNLRNKRLEVNFPERFTESSYSTKEVIINEWHYRLDISLRSSFEICTIGGATQQESTAILIVCESPPEISRQYDVEDSIRQKEATWNADRARWLRVIDLCQTENAPKPASVRNAQCNANLGRWITYRISLNRNKIPLREFDDFLNAMKDFNRPIQHIAGFQMIDQHVPSVFEMLEVHHAEEDHKSIDLHKALDKVYLDFEVRYQLEVCISEGYLPEYNLGQEFLIELKSMSSDRARGLLVAVAAQKRRYYNPMEIFKDVRIKPDRTSLPGYCYYARSVVISPTTMYVATPSLDVSNRVIRRYREHTDRFLRVHFAEERPNRKIGSAKDKNNKTMLYFRVKEVLMNGLIVGNRHYHFLAFGNSQLKENTAYFFCPLGHITPESIRSWMGNFGDKVVAKYAARLGQCFSTTRAILGVHFKIARMDDDYTTDGQHCFTDGVGIVSEFVAKIAAGEMGVLKADGSSPSALQFRLGGCKGVLVVWPSFRSRTGADVLLRPTQEKFHAQYQGLEVVRWSQFSSAYLNRQFISILTTLGVRDNIFMDMLNNQLADLDRAMIDSTKAACLLQRDVDPNQMSLEVAAMVKNEFMGADEPFMVSVLQLWRAYTIKYLKEKARILIHQGAHLLGVVDESSLLRGHLDDGPTIGPDDDKNPFLAKGIGATDTPPSGDPRIDSLPEIFVQISWADEITGEMKYKIIEGPVLLARHPSLFPSDIRVVRAVRKENLFHLKDVVVLPKRGKRDLASMCSGGDLDGDDFVVVWDKRLIPKEWNIEAPLFTAPKPVNQMTAITVDDISSFFVQFIQNDSLGIIANAHLARADRSDFGAKDPKCLRLAALASTAVDYPKTGQPAVMDSDLRVKEWPHFMEKPPGQTYTSYTALGQLYDRVERVNFTPDYNKPFDERILNTCNANEETLVKVAQLKIEYDEAVKRIMTQYGIKWELEVWSTFVLHHDDESGDFKFHEIIGRLSSSLKETFRNRCYQAAGGREYEKLAPYVAAMYKVTSLQVRDAMLRVKEGGSHDMPFISFPWIFSSVLGNIATGRTIMAKIEPVHVTSQRILTMTFPAPSVEERPIAKIGTMADEDNFVQTGDTTTHIGEMLGLFNNPGVNDSYLSKVEDLIDFGDPDEDVGNEVVGREAGQEDDGGIEHSQEIDGEVAQDDSEDDGQEAGNQDGGDIDQPAGGYASGSSSRESGASSVEADVEDSQSDEDLHEDDGIRRAAAASSALMARLAQMGM